MCIEHSGKNLIILSIQITCYTFIIKYSSLHCTVERGSAEIAIIRNPIKLPNTRDVFGTGCARAPRDYFDFLPHDRSPEWDNPRCYEDRVAGTLIARLNFIPAYLALVA